MPHPSRGWRAGTAGERVSATLAIAVAVMMLSVSLDRLPLLGRLPRAHATGDAYSAQVLADNPVSYWRLDEASGTTAADQQGSNAGTITGGVTLNQPGVIPGNAS